MRHSEPDTLVRRERKRAEVVDAASGAEEALTPELLAPVTVRSRHRSSGAIAALLRSFPSKLSMTACCYGSAPIYSDTSMAGSPWPIIARPSPSRSPVCSGARGRREEPP